MAESDILPFPEKEEEFPVSRTDMLKVIWAWKKIKGIPTDGPAGKAWNQAHYPWMSKWAKRMILTFGGDWKKAVDCIVWVVDHLEDNGYTYPITTETILKRSDLYFEYLAKKEKK